MKKILLLFALIMTMGAVNAKTDKLYATLAAENDGIYSENVFTWTSAPSNGGGQRLKLFNNMKGNIDLTKFKYLHIKISNKSAGAGWRFVIMCNNNANTEAYHSTSYGSTTDVTVDLTSLTLNDGSARTLAEVNGIYVQGQWKEGYFTILAEDCYLETDEYECMGITTSLTSSSTKDSPFQFYEQSNAEVYVGSKFQNNIGNNVTNGVIFGHQDGNATAVYFDVAGYDKFKVNLTTAADNQIRLMYQSTTTTLSTVAGTTSYPETSLDKITKIANIKTKNGGSNIIQVASIDFIKEYLPTSTTPFNIAASSSSTVNYNRSFTDGEKYTICLPFALTSVEVSTAGTFYELSSVEGETLNFTTVTETEAYKPYIFVPSSTGTPFANLSGKAIDATTTNNTTIGSYTFKGVLAASSDVQGDNNTNTVYGFRAADGKFVKVTGNSVSINAFRAYITVSTPMSRGFIDTNFGDGTTAIKKVETAIDDNPNAPIYNLAGQQVDANYKGVVIKNGRKQIQK